MGPTILYFFKKWKSQKIESYIFSEIKKFKFMKNLVQNSSSFSRTGLCLIKSLNNIAYLIYIHVMKNIIFFNIKNDKITSIIKNAHSTFIDDMKCYLSK